MILTPLNCSDIRAAFRDQFTCKQFVQDKTGCDMLEIIGCTFLADEPAIFGTPNADYITRELEWYKSASLNVNDIPGGPPKIWKAVATADGTINSNYGHLIYSAENGYQFDSVLRTLLSDPTSRRAQMIYTRPSIQTDYNRGGMSDFICTDAVQYFIRDAELIAHVRMRSNDVYHGYRNDWAWQKHVQVQLTDAYNKESAKSPITVGDIIWTAGSLHMYPLAFKYL